MSDTTRRDPADGPKIPEDERGDMLGDGADRPAPSEKPGLLDNFVQRTDNDYEGVTDASLIGEDIGDDEVDEDGEPVER